MERTSAKINLDKKPEFKTVRDCNVRKIASLIIRSWAHGGGPLMVVSNDKVKVV